MAYHNHYIMEDAGHPLNVSILLILKKYSQQ